MKWQINGLQIPVDLEDLETAKRLEEAHDIMEAEENELKKLIASDSGKLSDRIQGYCDLYFHLFENLFGTETARQIFQNQPLNMRSYEETYLSFLRFVMNTRVSIADRRHDDIRTLGMNRQQKRKLDKKFKKKKKHK